MFPSAPSSWSLDGEGRETVPYIQGPTGGVIMPPVPPRSFPPGKNNHVIIYTLFMGKSPLAVMYTK